jgi:hypothetical protein
MGQAAGATVVFAGEDEEPLLGVTVLESAGFMLDPRQERLIERTPKRKHASREGKRTAQAHRQREDDYWTESALKAEAQARAKGEKPIPFAQVERELDRRRRAGRVRRGRQ